MRKELLVYVDSGERDEEVSVRSVSTNRDLVIITNSIGKFTANRAELLKALEEIAAFDNLNNTDYPNGNILVDDSICFEEII